MDKDMYFKLFRQQLSKTLNQMKISDRQLSISLEASEGYINNIINARSGISLDKVFEIAILLDIPPRTLFEFDTPQENRLARMQTAFLQIEPQEQEYWLQLLEAKVQSKQPAEQIHH